MTPAQLQPQQVHLVETAPQQLQLQAQVRFHNAVFEQLVGNESLCSRLTVLQVNAQQT